MGALAFNCNSLVQGEQEGTGQAVPKQNTQHEDLRAKRGKPKGLMFVDVQVNDKPVRALVDSGATHNFVSERVVPKLRMDLVESTQRMKAVNSEARRATNVSLVVGT